jgi:hypothetical protein
MRKYTVIIPEVHNSYVTIDMEDDATDEAIKDKANLLLESGDYLDALEYSHTMDMDMWDITEVWSRNMKNSFPKEPEFPDAATFLKGDSDKYIDEKALREMAGLE